jgi:hypothetical protein
MTIRHISRRSPSPPSDRDRFVVDVATRANGQLMPIRDAVLAMMTKLDIENLARRTLQSTETPSIERNAARQRLLRAINGG